MDDLHMPFMSLSSLNTSENSNEVDLGLHLSSHSVLDVGPYMYDSERCKRKRNVEEDDVSLVLELGSPGTRISLVSKPDCTKTVLSSHLDAEKQSPLVDICLDLNIESRRKRTHKDLASVKDKSKFHLELSLSTGGADSDLTSVTLTSSPHRNVISEIEQLVDEGSTSSKWKCGPVIPLMDMLLGNPSTIVSDIHPVVAPVSLSEMNDVSFQSKQRKTSVKICQFLGCEKGARGASGYCISHGGGRRCQRLGCSKGAEGKTAFCKAHGGGRRCEYLGCTKSAEGRTNLCIAHGGGKRCGFQGGCNRAARGKSGLCIRHGGGKRCKIENCTKSAEGLAGLCIAHGGGRRCQFPECKKGAQGSTKFCKAHGGGKRCTFLGCTKGAEGSTPFCKGHGGGKRCSFQGEDGGSCTKSVHGGTLYCVSHGGGKRCAINGCSKSARGRTNFCVRHGGGKRCKYEGCGKSAQGSTDFCKAHGGGKRCLWGQQGSGFGGDGEVPCDKFARGKIGLCAAHGAQVQDKRVHGDGTVGLKMKGVVNANALECTENVGASLSVWNGFDLQMVLPDDGPTMGPSSSSRSLEGRVHGGGFMAAMLGKL